MEKLMKKIIIKHVTYFEKMSRYIMYFLLTITLILFLINLSQVDWSFFA